MTLVGSHDTASAVVGGAGRRRPVRLHLVRHLVAGRHRARRADPDRGEPARRTSRTRAGSTGAMRYLHNVMGLWLLQESIRTWERAATGSSSRRARRPPPRCRRRARRSIPTTPASSPRATCRRGSARPAGRADTASRRTARPRASCAASSTASRSPSPGASRDAARLSGRHVEVVHVVGGGSAERAAVPADRRRVRPAGGRRVRSRRRRSATARPGPGDRARSTATSGRSGRSSGRPSRSAATSRAATGRTRSTMRSPSSSPASTTSCSPTSARRRSRCSSASGTRSFSRPARPAAARSTSTPATGTCVPLVERFVDAFAEYDVDRHAVAVVRGDDPPPPRDVAEHARRGTPGARRRASPRRPARPRADRVPGGRARRRPTSAPASPTGSRSTRPATRSRLLGIGDRPRRLLAAVEGLEIVDAGARRRVLRVRRDVRGQEPTPPSRWARTRSRTWPRPAPRC